MKFIRENWFKLGVLIALVCVILTVHASKDESGRLSRSESVNPLVQKEHSTYTNSHYGYSISYPNSWSRSQVAGNNDGVILYTGNPQVDVRVSTRLASDDTKIGNETLVLDNGSVATLIKTVGSLEVVLTKEETEYVFLVTAPTKYLEQDGNTLLQIARTLTVK